MIKSIYKNWFYLLLTILIAVICSGLDGFLSIFMMKSVDAATQGNRDLFNEEVIRLLLIALLLIPATIALSYAKGVYKRKSIISLKYNYIKGVFNKNINEFQKDNNSKYVSTLINDINIIENDYIDGLYQAVIYLINFIVGIIIIGIVSPVALGVGVSIGVLNTVISILLSKPVEKHLTQRSELYEKYTSYIKEVLGAFHIIKGNNLNNKVNEDFYKKSYSLQHKGYVIDKIYTYICSLQDLNMNLAIYIIFGITVYIAIKGKLTIGGVILVVTNIQKIMGPLTEMGELMPRIFSSKKLFVKIDDTLKNYDNFKEQVVLKEFTKSIKFSNVSFAYDDMMIFKDINLSIRKGEKYLVVGPSGSGKSTLLKLLRKYYSPKTGNIFIDETNLRDVTKESYFKYISNVEQQVFLFEDTIKNNITLYKNYSDDEINEVIEKAGLRTFIYGLEKGLDTTIYDNGINVSGGEKSRIAIARGLLQKADIIFMDEAFASLDSKVAKEIENTILNLEGITVINVSHIIFEDTKRKYSNVLMVKNKRIYSV